MYVHTKVTMWQMTKMISHWGGIDPRPCCPWHLQRCGLWHQGSQHCSYSGKHGRPHIVQVLQADSLLFIEVRVGIRVGADLLVHTAVWCRCPHYHKPLRAWGGASLLVVRLPQRMTRVLFTSLDSFHCRVQSPIPLTAQGAMVDRFLTLALNMRTKNLMLVFVNVPPSAPLIDSTLLMQFWNELW